MKLNNYVYPKLKLFRIVVVRIRGLKYVSLLKVIVKKR